ncbi:hypothetical protein BDR05DRAFT_996427 [Suillus weaverae]|nr:hypothetical protein BDR05DRAFT_996427 [Suillus weaverae]
MVSELACSHDARSSVLESQSQPPQPRNRNVAVLKPRVRPALLQRLSVGDARPVVETRGVVLDSQSRGVAMEQPRGLGMETQTASVQIAEATGIRVAEDTSVRVSEGTGVRVAG